MSKKILICDDEDGVNESLKMILGKEFDLIITDAGQQCLDVVAKQGNRLGAVLLDIKLPRMSGMDVLSIIHQNHPNLPVIMITGYQAVQTVSESSAKGASAYLTKPFDDKQVLETVRKFTK